MNTFEPAAAASGALDALTGVLPDRLHRRLRAVGTGCTATARSLRERPAAHSLREYGG
ncbi:hypothetical protein [Actinacidiphila guanduensis]|uniref:hypothetical protein n=1 Tax=Actinacidiphila guanduensis TaxID=310781 RepID=UPI00159F8BFD|nr:hypothetical protein [Actinacidiphila guanduensis]